MKRLFTRGDNRTRFMAKVYETSSGGHWHWLGAGECDGQFRMRDGRRLSPYRAAFTIFIGPPGAMSIVRRCGDLRCVSPWHCEIAPSASWRHGSSRAKAPEYTAWLNARHNAGMCARWDDYTNFLADMGRRPSGKWLTRRDKSQAHGPGNSFWDSPAGVMRRRAPRVQEVAQP